MIMLLDIGNTHTHLGLASFSRVTVTKNIPTSSWAEGKGIALVRQFTGCDVPKGVLVCSVVPSATPLVRKTIRHLWGLSCLELTPVSLRGVGIDYPKPETIGPDRLANAVAARHHFGAPSVVVDFGTAVTFDVVNRSGNYSGGIIPPPPPPPPAFFHTKNPLFPP